MTRRFRLSILALLLLAYGLAAVGVAAFLPGGAPTAERMVVDGHAGSSALPQILSLALDENPPDRSAVDDGRLLQELGDTSDDHYDHCVPHVVVARVGPPRMRPIARVDTPAPDIWPPRMLRPPNETGARA